MQRAASISKGAVVHGQFGETHHQSLEPVETPFPFGGRFIKIQQATISFLMVTSWVGLIFYRLCCCWVFFSCAEAAAADSMSVILDIY